jgi:hypothetical protein
LLDAEAVAYQIQQDEIVSNRKLLTKSTTMTGPASAAGEWTRDKDRNRDGDRDRDRDRDREGSRLTQLTKDSRTESGGNNKDVRKEKRATSSKESASLAIDGALDESKSSSKTESTAASATGESLPPLPPIPPQPTGSRNCSQQMSVPASLLGLLLSKRTSLKNSLLNTLQKFTDTIISKIVDNDHRKEHRRRRSQESADSKSNSKSADEDEEVKGDRAENKGDEEEDSLDSKHFQDPLEAPAHVDFGDAAAQCLESPATATPTAAAAGAVDVVMFLISGYHQANVDTACAYLARIVRGDRIGEVLEELRKAFPRESSAGRDNMSSRREAPALRKSSNSDSHRAGGRDHRKEGADTALPERSVGKANNEKNYGKKNNSNNKDDKNNKNKEKEREREGPWRKERLPGHKEQQQSSATAKMTTTHRLRRGPPAKFEANQSQQGPPAQPPQPPIVVVAGKADKLDT